MAGFEYRGQLNGAENPVVLEIPIANSATVTVGDALQNEAFGSGSGVKRAAAGTEILGVCIGIVDNKGIDLTNTLSSNYDGTWTASTKTYVATSDNMTDKIVKAQVVVDKNAIWYNDSAGTLAAADIMKFFDIADQDQVGDQDGADNAGAMILIKRDPDGDGDASKGLFIIAESELDAYAQQ